MADTITAANPTVLPPATSILHKTKVDLTDRRTALPVHLVQYDQTLPVIAVELTYAGRPYVLPTGAAVNIRMDKRDGHYVYNPALGVDTSRTVAYIVVTQQMTTNAGTFVPILEVVVDGGVAGTAPIAVYVDRNPVPEDAIASTDEYKTIEQLAAEVTASAVAASASADAAALSAAAADKSESQAQESAKNAAASEDSVAQNAASAAQSAAVAAAQTQQANQALQDAEAASQAATASAAEAANYAAITAGERILNFYIDPTDGGLNCLINTEPNTDTTNTTNATTEVQHD